jgi:hypothetical protein
MLIISYLAKKLIEAVLQVSIFAAYTF